MKRLLLNICLAICGLSAFGQSENGLVVISEIMYDSPLNERIATGVPYSNGEYIELFNLDRDDCDLSGWMVRGGGVTEKYILPEGTTIPGKGCLLFAYQYKDTNFALSDLYEERVADNHTCKIIYQRKIILSNKGESLSIYDECGNLRDSIYYDGTSHVGKWGRLHAANEDDNPGPLCVSLHRSDVRYNGRALCPEVSSSYWCTDDVSPGSVPYKTLKGDYTNTYRGNFIKSVDFASADGGDLISRTDFYDGLGYLEQTVDHAFSPSGGDRITLYEHNGAGIIVRHWLPAVFADGNGRNEEPEVLKAKIRNDLHDDRPYAEYIFEGMSLPRKTQEFLPGQIFADNNRRKEYVYELNGYENVIKFTVSDSGDELTAAGYYRIGRLRETISYDEQRHMIITYTDVAGKEVLVRRLFEGEPQDTYFVYDDMDRLRWVITPKASDQMNIGQTYASDSSLAQKLCYLYWYDARGNIVSKRLPGRGEDSYIYDEYGRLASRYLKTIRPSSRTDSLLGPTPDRPQRSVLYFLNYFYDDFNRVEQEVVRTIGVEVISHSYIQAIYRYGGTLYPEDVELGVSGNISVGQGEQKLFEIPSHLAFEPVDGVISEEDVDRNNRGLKIYEKLVVMDSLINSADPNVVERAFYYDLKGRVVQTVEKNHLGGISRFSQKTDLIGKKLAASESVRVPGVAPVEKKVFYTYDRYGRLLTERTTVAPGPTVNIKYEYNDRGQLVRKTLSSGATSISDTLQYNLQGWQTEQHYRMNGSDLFRTKLRYYDSTIHNYSRRFNGDISEWEWQHGNDSSKTYVFAYDGLNRFDNAELYHGGSTQPDKAFTETGFSYDANGNLYNLVRYGASPDTPETSYSMSYDGNRLLKVAHDAEKSFEYDGHGNMTYDYLRDVHLTYDYFDMIENVTRNDKIIAKYTYLWDGTELSVRDGRGDGYEYLGSWVYRRQGDSLWLESIPFTDGRYLYASTTDSLKMIPHFYLTDHLGSVRVIVDGWGNVTERNDYYPFGKRWEHPEALLSDNRFLYAGKERQVTGGLGWLDYGARMYDSDLVRWLTMDPKAEAYYLTSPYVFCVNNPLRFIDTDGRSIRDVLWGIFIGTLTNFTGDNSLREKYIPENADHYNNSLHAADVGAFAFGATSFISGGAEIIGGASAGVMGTLGTGGAAAALAVPTGAAIVAHGAATMGAGMMLMKNAGSNLGKAYNYKGPEPNDGRGNPHGGTDHNSAIDKKLQEVREQENVKEVRKNQQQVDVDGNVVGRNRPDLQWNKDGVHYNFEVDRSVRNNVKHERVIRKNDPKAIYEQEILDR